MDYDTMFRCLEAVANYLRNKDESPLCAKDIIEIKKTLEDLIERNNWLICLEEAGVDNWEGMEYAYELRRERK